MLFNRELINTSPNKRVQSAVSQMKQISVLAGKGDGENKAGYGTALTQCVCVCVCVHYRYKYFYKQKVWGRLGPNSTVVSLEEIRLLRISHPPIFVFFPLHIVYLLFL